MPSTELQERLYKRWALTRQEHRCACGAPVTLDDHLETWPVWLVVCAECLSAQLDDEAGLLEREL